MSETKKILTDYIKEELQPGYDDGEIAEDQNILKGGMVDSLGVMKLVSFIEKEFDVEIPDEDMKVQNFSSLKDIGAYLEQKMTGDG